MMRTKLHNLILALLLCAGTVAIAQNTTGYASDTVDALLVLQEELMDAKTPDEIEAAKAKAVAAGVPVDVVTSTVVTTLRVAPTSIAAAPPSVEAVEEATTAAATAAATATATATATPTPTRNVAKTQTTTQPPISKSLSVGGSTKVSQISIPAGSTNIGDTGSTYN